MPGVNRVILLVGLSGMVGWCQPVWATIDNLKTYKQVYPEKAKATSCKTCHDGAMGTATNLNGYGKALKQLPAPANPKKLTIEDYKAAEAADPDQDGATTLQELEAGTNPSDPASVPPAATSAAPTSAAGADTSTGSTVGSTTPNEAEGSGTVRDQQPPKQPAGP